ncbi:MAG: phenylacetate--CoA ligase family protein [Slackia sp.]
MYYQEEIECMPRAELEVLQVERLRWAVKHAYENVPLYKQRFDEAGLDPYSIESLEDIKRFPFIVKQDMRDAYPFGLFAVDRSEVKRLHASSGTTGQATVVGYTENDLKNWGDCFARGIAMVGGSAESDAGFVRLRPVHSSLGAHMGGEGGRLRSSMSTGNTSARFRS